MNIIFAGGFLISSMGKKAYTIRAPEPDMHLKNNTYLIRPQMTMPEGVYRMKTETL